MKRSGFLKSIATLAVGIVAAPALLLKKETGKGLIPQIQESSTSILSDEKMPEFSTLSAGYDIHDRDFYKKLIKKIPRHNSLDFLHSLEGNPRKQHVYKFYES